jgi:hypothetical protein
MICSPFRAGRFSAGARGLTAVPFSERPSPHLPGRCVVARRSRARRRRTVVPRPGRVASTMPERSAGYRPQLTCRPPRVRASVGFGLRPDARGARVHPAARSCGRQLDRGALPSTADQSDGPRCHERSRSTYRVTFTSTMTTAMSPRASRPSWTATALDRELRASPGLCGALARRE